MNGPAIKNALVDVKTRLALAEAEVKKVLVDWDALRSICDHEGAVRTTHMGERCRHCYDCETCL